MSGQPDQGQAGFAPAVLVESLLGRMTSVCIQVATVDLGLPDLLADGPLPIDDLARRTGTDPDVLLLFLRALTSHQIFVEVGPTVFANTEMSSFLRSGAFGSLRGIAELVAAEWVTRVWDPAEVVHTLRTGEPAFEHVFGMSFWTYMKTHPDQDAVFSRSQAVFSEPTDDAVVRSYDFSRCGTVVDVGGGEGGFLEALMTAFPQVRGILLDRPEVVEQTRRRFEGSPLLDRLEFVGADFFEYVPPGADAYVIKHVLMDWGDDQASDILARCREAMAPGARVLIPTYLVPSPPQIPQKVLMAGLWVRLNSPGGYERNRAQFEAVLGKAGLRLERVLETPSTHSILETFAATEDG